MASDPLATFDIQTMKTLSQYYNALNLVIAKHAAVEVFASTHIVPYMDTTPLPFYHLDGQLKPEFTQYIVQVRDVLTLIEVVEAMGNQSIEALEQPLQ